MSYLDSCVGSQFPIEQTVQHEISLSEASKRANIAC